MLCPQSRHKPEIEISNDSEPARLGSAAHKALATFLRDERPDFEQIRNDFLLPDTNDLRFLFFTGKDAWDVLKEEYGTSVLCIERKINGVFGEIEFTGSADIIGESDGGKTLDIIDWKTGRVERNYNPQLKLYGYMYNVMNNMQYEKIRTFTVELREKEIDMQEYSVADLQEFITEVEEVAYSDKYNIGSWCGFCPRSTECEARAKSVQSLALAITGNNMPALTPETIAKYYGKVKDIMSFCERFREEGAEIIAKSGPVPLEDGTILGLSTKKDSSIDTDKARELFGDSVALEAAKLTKGKLMMVLTKDADNKAQAKRDALALLEDAGAIEYKESKPFLKPKKA